MKDNKLEIGDVVFCWHHSYPSYLTKHKIIRLTPQRAILDNNDQVKNELTDGHFEQELCARGIGDSNDALLWNERLEGQYKEQILRNKARKVITSISSKNISVEQCKGLIDLFPEVFIEPAKTNP